MLHKAIIIYEFPNFIKRIKKLNEKIIIKNKISNETKLSPLAKSIVRGLKKAIAHKRGRPVK